MAINKSNMDRGMRNRFYSFVVLNSVLIFVWIVYLFTVQLLDPHDLGRYKEVIYTPVKEIQSPSRGNIYDRNHDLLVRTEHFYQIDFDRFSLSNYRNGNRQALTEDYKRIAEIISGNSSLSYHHVLNRLNRTAGSSSIYLSDRIKESDMVRIEREMREHNYLRGMITNYSFQQRVYPKERLAGRLLGAVSQARDTGSQAALSQLEGLCGIELTYDRDLRGVYGWKKLLLDARRIPLQIPNLGKQKVKNGNSLTLTIDSRIQEIVEMNLKEGLEAYRANNAVGIVMDPKTGEILALSSISPSDKHNSPGEIRVKPNLATSFMFEPGSTLKAFTSLVALEKRLFKPDDMIDCRTYTTEHNRVIRDSDPYEDLSFEDVLAHSSNVGISRVADKIGSDALYETLISFGFGNRTGSDISGESAGLLRKVSDWQGYSLHSISYGQEVAVTPLQLINAYAALANDGKLMRPYVVKEVVDENNRVIKRNSPRRIRTVSSRSALNTLKEMMSTVIEYGTATGTKLPYVSIAGKTGTAQKRLEGQRGYALHKYISNFVGFFPIEDPQYVILVLYDEPAYYYHYASMSAVVSFRKITEQILALPDCKVVPGMRMQEMNLVTMPDLIGSRFTRAQRTLERNDINYQIAGSPKGDNIVIVNQFPKQGVQFEKSQTVIIVVDNEKVLEDVVSKDQSPSFKMPSLIDMTLREALSTVQKYQINLEIQGKGLIVFQSIHPGQTIDYGVTCRVRAN